MLPCTYYVRKGNISGICSTVDFRNNFEKVTTLRDVPFSNLLLKHKTVNLHNTSFSFVFESSNTEKFNVEKVNTEDIIDFKKWAQLNFKAKPLSVRSYGKDVPKNQKVNFQVSAYYEFVFDPKQPGEVIAKNYIDNDISKEIFVLSRVKGTCSNLPSQANRAYNGKVPINHLKIADIAKVKQYIPAEFTEFYDEILQWPTTNEREPSEEDF